MSQRHSNDDEQHPMIGDNSGERLEQGEREEGVRNHPNQRETEKGRSEVVLIEEGGTAVKFGTIPTMSAVLQHREVDNRALGE
jgi:hypothetical protein